MTTDHDLRDELIDGERAVPLDTDADRRVRTRMLAAFEDTSAGTVIELETYTPVERPPARARRRPLALAAAAAIVVAGAVGLMLTDRDDAADDGLVSAATPVATAEAGEPVISALGYLPFSNYNLLADANPTAEASVEIIDRALNAMVEADGSTVMEVRRQLGGAVIVARESIEFVVTTTVDGQTLVPIEVAVPFVATSPGNECVGGRVEIGHRALDQQVMVTCGSDAAQVQIAVTTGPAELLPILDEPVAAVPVTFTVSTDDETLATSTHWYDEYGLVRQDVEFGGATYEAEMNAGDLTRRNLGLGLIEDAD